MKNSTFVDVNGTQYPASSLDEIVAVQGAMRQAGIGYAPEYKICNGVKRFTGGYIHSGLVKVQMQLNVSL